MRINQWYESGLTLRKFGIVVTLLQSKLQRIYPKEIKKIILFTTGLVILFCLYSYTFDNAANKKQIIENIMKYPMAPILQRCKKDYSYTDEDMNILERELKRYFVFSAFNKTGHGMYSKDVDNLWHTFILFTKDYAHFCNKYIGNFIDHVPETDTAKTPEALSEVRDDFREFVKNYTEIFKEEVHPIWFLDTCEAQ